MIRLATIEDIPQCMKWARAFFAYHPVHAQFAMDEPQIEQVLKNLIEMDDAVLFVHKHGMIGGLINASWINPKIKSAGELFWWAEKNGLSLLTAFENWATEKNAFSVQMLGIEGRRDVSPIYKRRGYKKAETIYERLL